MLNASSIGIEIVHPGAKIAPDGTREYLPFPKAQIDALVPLVQDIVRRYQIKPETGCSAMPRSSRRPSRDPGPTFPWKLFSELGITPPWPDAARVEARRLVFEAAPPDAVWWRQAFAKHGYELAAAGSFDDELKKRHRLVSRCVYRPRQLQRSARRRDGRPAVRAGEPAADGAGALNPQAGADD